MSVNKPVGMNGFWDWGLILENLFVIAFPTDGKRLELNFTAANTHVLYSEIRMVGIGKNTCVLRVRESVCVCVITLVCSSEEIKLILCDSHF